MSIKGSRNLSPTKKQKLNLVSLKIQSNQTKQVDTKQMASHHHHNRERNAMGGRRSSLTDLDAVAQAKLIAEHEMRLR